MAKKGTRPAKTNQQRAREEQWKRRLASQGQGEAGLLMVDEPAFDAGGGETMPALSEAQIAAVSITATPRTMSATRSTAGTASTARTNPASATAAATQRRATAAARTARTRAAANVMTVDDEMHYVRTDIRRLITLTVACLLVLIVLFFLIPR